MDCTHIFVICDASHRAQFSLFDAEGVKVYEGHCTLQLAQYVQAVRNRKLDERAHEQIVRQITRECVALDIGMSTPIFAA